MGILDPRAARGVNIAVCGRFHYPNYVHHLHERGGLNRFYYAARLRHTPGRMGLPRDRAVNLFPKEYLGGLHARLLGDRLLHRGRALYHDLWQLGVLARWRPAPLLHLLLHGNGRMLIRRAKREGARVVGEPVNAHPEDLGELLAEEHERLGLPPYPRNNPADRRLAEEAVQCDHLLAGSNLVKDSYVRHGYPAERITVIPYGVDIRRFAPPRRGTAGIRGPALPPVRFRVTCVGRITPRKGQVYLLEAWRRLRLPGAELVLVGALSPAMRPVLRRYEGEFRYVPPVPHDRLPSYYGTSHCFVLPSLEDGFAYVCNEALACGLPVITTRAVGASEVLEEGGDGFIVPARAPEALAEKLELLYRDRRLRDAMAARAAERAAERTWERYAEAVHRFHGEVCRAGT